MESIFIPYICFVRIVNESNEDEKLFGTYNVHARFHSTKNENGFACTNKFSKKKYKKI